MNIKLATKVVEVRELVFLTFQHYLAVRSSAGLVYNGKMRVARIRQEIDSCRKRQDVLFRSIENLESLSIEVQNHMYELAVNLEAVVGRIQTRLEVLEKQVDMEQRVLGKKAA